MRETRVKNVTVEVFNAPLREPFVIAGGDQAALANVLVTVELDNGIIGYGEAAPLPAASGETQAGTLTAARRGAGLLRGFASDDWRSAARLLHDLGAPAAQAGLEMALVDAVAKDRRVPLWRLLAEGAAMPASVITDVTVPIVPPTDAARLARGIAALGATVIKVKIGRDPAVDLARIAAIRDAAPHCELLLDANQGYDVVVAVAVAKRAIAEGARCRWYEQPVPREQRAALSAIQAETGLPVIADEAVRDGVDLAALVAAGGCAVVNLKLMKSGISGCLDLAVAARAHGMHLMMGGMVETRLGMGCAAHLAAGLGDFVAIDLDTPLLLAVDPCTGPLRIDGVRYRFDDVSAGIGVWPSGRPSGHHP